MSIRIGTGSTTSSTTNERLYLNSSVSDAIVMRSCNVTAVPLNIVYNGVSRFGNCNNDFYCSFSNSRYFTISCNVANMYDTLTIAKSNIQVKGSFTSDTLASSQLTITGDATCTSSLTANNVISNYLSYQGRNMITYTGLSPEPSLTVDAVTLFKRRIILEKKLEVDDIDIKNVTFRCNVNYPALKLQTSDTTVASETDVFNITHDPNVNLSGCNLIKVLIDDPISPEVPAPAFVVSSTGNVGINTTFPVAALDIHYGCNTTLCNLLAVHGANNSSIAVDKQCRIGIGTTNTYHKIQVNDCNLRNPIYYDADDIFQLNPRQVVLDSLIGLYTSSCNSLYSPLISGYSNSSRIFHVAGSGKTTIGNDLQPDVHGTDPLLRVNGVAETHTLVASNIRSSSALPIDFESSTLSNIQNVLTSNISVSGTASAVNLFAEIISACNLVFPGVNISELTTAFQANTVSFTGEKVNFGTVTDDSVLKQPFFSRKMLISMDEAEGTSVALGVVGNNTGRNTIRITCDSPALELFSTANNVVRKSAAGVDLSGYYISYTTLDTQNATELNTRKQFQITPYGVRIGKTMQVVPTITDYSTSAGCVGIGLPSADESVPALPRHKLHVQGGVWVQSGNIAASRHPNTSPLFYVDEGTGRVGIRTSTPLRDLHIQGSVFAESVETTLPLVTSSDSRLKTDLEPITDALNRVRSLTGYTFRRISPSQSAAAARETGLIAQEVQKVLPEAVNVSESDGTLGVTYGNLAGLFVEAIKAMSDKIDALETRISCLSEK